MAFSEKELLDLEIDASWEAFCDESPGRHAKLQQLTNEFYLLLKLAHAQGYITGARSELRKMQA